MDTPAWIGLGPLGPVLITPEAVLWSLVRRLASLAERPGAAFHAQAT